MKKAARTMLVLAVLVGAVAVGGYVWAEHTVRARIGEAFAAAERTEALNDVSYGGLDVDLWNDTVTFRNVRADVDAKAFMIALHPGPSALDAGMLEYSATAVTISGARNILLGKSPIVDAHAEDITLNAAFIQSFHTKTGTARAGSRLAGRIGSVSAEDIDFTAFDTVQSGGQAMPAFPAIGHLKYGAMTFDLAVTVKASARTETPPRSLKAQYVIGGGSAVNITPGYWGRAVVRDVAIIMDPQRSSGKTARPIALSIGEISITDATMHGTIPVKCDYAIKALRIPTLSTADPRLKGGLALLGLDEVSLDLRAAYDFDDAAHTFSLAPLKVRLKDVGSVEFGLDLSGVPTIARMRSAWTALAAAQDAEPPFNGTAMAEATKAELKKSFAALFAGLALRRVAVGYEDEGAVRKFLAVFGATTDGARALRSYVGQAEAVVSAAYGPVKGREARDAVAAFVADPSRLSVTLSAEKPVKIGDLERSFANAGPVMTLAPFRLDIAGP